MRAGWTAVTAVVSALVLSACGGGGGSPKKSPSPTATVHERVVSSKSAHAALLTIKDVGSPLAAVHYRNTTAPLYCEAAGGATLAKATSSTGQVGVHFTSKKPLTDIVEEVYLYRSSVAARAALTTAQGDLDCATGHIYNTDGTSDIVSVGAGTDYSAKLTADFAYGWSLRTTDSRGIELAILARTTLILMKYTVGNFADASKLPDPFDLAGTALDRMSRA